MDCVLGERAYYSNVRRVWSFITEGRSVSFSLLIIVIAISIVGEILFWILKMAKK